MRRAFLLVCLMLGGVAHAGLTSSVSASGQFSAAASFYRGRVLADGPAGYWRLGEASGTTATDVKGASNGTYAGSYTLGRPDPLVDDADTAIELDGLSGRISVPHTSALNLTTQLTIEAWVKPDSLTGTRWIVNRGTYYYLYISDGTTYFGIRTGAAYVYVTTTTVTTGSWQHLVGTYDGSTMNLYRDNSVVASAAISGAVDANTSAVFLGALDGTESFFDGHLDEIAIYGYALSAAQVQDHYLRAIPA